MKKDSKGRDIQRPYKLAHQTLCITGFNFKFQSLIGYVELLLHPKVDDLRRIKVNCKQGRIYRVCIQEQWEAAFLYNDPTLEICQGEVKQRNLAFFQQCHALTTDAVDPDLANGEVTIKLPPECFPLISEMKPLRVSIEFSLEQPVGGVKFITPDLDGSLAEKGAHLFTYGTEESSRLWFPCIDTFSEPCTWKLEFTVPKDMTAVSCGDLIETVYTEDMKNKTFHYFLSIPTAASNIALAVGPFEILVDPNMHEVTHFCLPHLLPILKHTTSFLHETFEFYEELLSIRYPYSCYKQVFVDQSYREAASYATMTIFSTNLLHSNRIIDQTIKSRKVMAQAVAHQFFGCFIAMDSWYDAWLPKGISKYLAYSYIKSAFGNNQYRYIVSKDLESVTNYEHNVTTVVLDPSQLTGQGHGQDNRRNFPIKYPHTISAKYLDMYHKKAHLIVRMLEIRIGRELLLQVFNKLLSLANTASQQHFNINNTWANMLLSASSFLKIMSTVTGKDIHVFLNQWVRQGGHARFYGNFVFNRKRNVVEMELKQDMSSKSSFKYAGPLATTIQELDGSFKHSFKIEENKTKFEITCHSKSRKNKKKKIPLMTGEEVDMDLGAMDADSPVLWLRVDADMTIIRHVTWEQPDFMWQYQLKYERDVVAQSVAIKALEQFPTPSSRMALTDIIENDHCFYRIRMEAAMGLANVANSMMGNWAGPPAMMTIFRKMFGSHSCPSIVRQNNFNNFQHYFLQKTIPVAMSLLRNSHGICPSEVLRFILDLFKYNDNSKNKFSDCYYRASLINALSNIVTQAITVVTHPGQGPTAASLSNDTKMILEEISRYLNLEKLLPCYRFTVTVSCLKGLRNLQRFGHIPCNPSLFKSYAKVGNFIDVRLAALEALVDITKTEGSMEDLLWLLDLVETDSDPYVRHQILQMFLENPPFTKQDSSEALSTEQLVERLWKMMNCKFSSDPRLRCGVADLYYTFYGKMRPSCLSVPDSMIVLNLKSKTTFLNASVTQADEKMDENLTESRSDSGMDLDLIDPEVIHQKDDLAEDIIASPPVDIQDEDSDLDIAAKRQKMDNSGDEENVQESDKDVYMSTGVISETISVTTSRETVVPYMASNDSNEDSNSLPPSKLEPDGGLGEYMPSLLAASQDGETPGGGASGYTATPSGEISGEHQRRHKEKKKKKKNKHKHKHKHKHDKSEKSSRHSDKADVGPNSESQTVFSYDTPTVPILDSANISEPSSPEYEVI